MGLRDGYSVSHNEEQIPAATHHKLVRLGQMGAIGKVPAIPLRRYRVTGSLAIIGKHAFDSAPQSGILNV
jgi:hypothetical protein